MSLEQRQVAATCAECGREYQKTEYLVCGEWTWGAAICGPCDEKRVVTVLRKGKRPLWETRFHELVPADMRELDPAKLPDREAHDAAMRWRTDSGKSLLLVGHTGMGKSRTMYAKLEAILRANPAVEVVKFDCISFGEMSKAKSYVGRGAEWLEYLRRVDLVIFDDLFRGNLTGAIQEELFGLISARTEERRPMIATTQFTEKTLGHVMQEHHVAAIARRFREHFHVVPFRKQTTQTKDDRT